MRRPHERPSGRMLGPAAIALGLVAAGCSGGGQGPDAGGQGTDPNGQVGSGDGGAVARPDASVVDGPATAPCDDEPIFPGPVQEFSWPAAVNIGHEADPETTLRFAWEGTHSVIQVGYWDDPLEDPGWEHAIRSGEPSADGSFDWDIGTFPCGYRPGLYYFAEPDNAVQGVVAVSVTVPEFDNDFFEPRPCSDLDDPWVYGGRYAPYADREGCTQHEINNFQTEPHYDWVRPTFAVTQGDLVLVRWTGIHNVVQVHHVHLDQPYNEHAFQSGPKTNCVGGPGYSCANGPPSLGETLFDTATWRPGMIHISDQCAYNDETCPAEYQRPGGPNATGMNAQFLISRRDRPTISERGACGEIDPDKGDACRIIDLYNDGEGLQFEYNVPVSRNDLVRIRWAGTLEIEQTVPNADGSPSRDPLPGGITKAETECLPGPDWTCLDGNTAAAELILDIAAMLDAGQYCTNPSNQPHLTFQAYGENEPGFTSADSGMLFYVTDASGNAPACP